MENPIVTQAITILSKINPKTANAIKSNPQLVNQALQAMGKYSKDKNGATQLVQEIRKAGLFEKGKKLVDSVPFGKQIAAGFGINLDELLNEQKSTNTPAGTTGTQNYKDRLKKLK